jgi:transcriptional regulator with XRE-family HTH domain
MRKITKLKLRLLERGLSQKQLAEKAQINRGLVSLICNGRYIPSEQQRARIAEAIQLPEDQLFEKVYRV